VAKYQARRDKKPYTPSENPSNLELEIMTQKFLQENDEFARRRDRKNKMEYPYHSQRQTNIRMYREITVSNLKEEEKKSCYKLIDQDFDWKAM
jgi:hypothetical protein